MKRWIGIALILVPILAPAAAFWDGNAALQRGDASFEAGMFGASNSFAPDTLVLVQNLDTGKTTTVTITGRISGQSDILVLLSPPAAAAIGIKSGTLVSVRLTIAGRSTASSASSVAEQTTTRDPDLNPSVAYGGPTGTAATNTTATTTGSTATTIPAVIPPAATPSLESLPPAHAPVTAAAAPVPTTSPEVPPVETAPQTAVATTTQAATPTSTVPAGPSAAELKAASDAAILAEASSRKPPKKVFLPPREDKTFAYVPPAPTQTTQTAQTTQTTQTATVVPTTPAEPQITAIIGEPGATPQPQAQGDLALAEAAAPEESVPTEIVGADTAQPEQTPEDLALAEAAAPDQSVPTEIVGADTVQPEQAPDTAVVAMAAPEPVGEDKPPTTTPQAGPPVQTEVTDPAAVPPATPPVVVALAAPEAPAPAGETPTVVAVVPTQNQTTTQQTTTQQTTTRPTAARPTQSETWYVQLAAYATEKGAQDAAARLAATYPTQVIAPATPGSRVFRVVVGPLNRAESGAVLVWFRSKGFPDAFVKQQ